MYACVQSRAKAGVRARPNPRCSVVSNPADDRIVLVGDSEATVVAAELGDEPGDRVRVVDVGHDVPQRRQELVALRAHRHREHRPRFGRQREQNRVEQFRRLVGPFRDRRPTGP